MAAMVLFWIIPASPSLYAAGIVPRLSQKENTTPSAFPRAFLLSCRLGRANFPHFPNFLWKTKRFSFSSVCSAPHRNIYTSIYLQYLIDSRPAAAPAGFPHPKREMWKADLNCQKSPVQPTCADGQDTYREIER
ncbi:hypothetical protein [Faecalibacterium sp. An58]|uniref:hypothetical protein n=1 Tax=Faecalibacterium sp. An58 TaxID=1965648 RepID=UPI001182028E|nr:hypothetical protein [Faecalibacterium sp. An58]